MIILQGEIIKIPEPCVLTVGKFESIHRGHQALIAEMKNYSLPSTLVVFDPHPYQLFVNPDYKPILTNQQRANLLAEMGIDYLVEYPFTRDFAALSPKGFCHILFNDLQARVVVVGEGFCFGRNRAGTIETLKLHAQPAGAQVKVLTPQQDGEKKISTSAIRALISEGKMLEAEDLLGWQLGFRNFDKSAPAL